MEKKVFKKFGPLFCTGRSSMAVQHFFEMELLLFVPGEGAVKIQNLLYAGRWICHGCWRCWKLPCAINEFCQWIWKGRYILGFCRADASFDCAEQIPVPLPTLSSTTLRWMKKLLPDFLVWLLFIYVCSLLIFFYQYLYDYYYFYHHHHHYFVWLLVSVSC